MPAVLRPNDEFPSLPLTKSRSPDSSSDSGSDTTLRRSNTGFMSLGGIVGRGSRRASESGKSSIDGEWNLDLFPDVTEPPTRKHWKVSLYIIIHFTLSFFPYLCLPRSS
jgi:hypothetical protein